MPPAYQEAPGTRILKMLECEPAFGVEEAAKKAYRYLMNDWKGLVGDIRELEIRDTSYNPCFTGYPEFQYMKLCRGWMVDNEKEV